MKILFFTNIPSPYRVTFFNLLSQKNDVTVLFDKGNEEERNEKWYKDNIYEFKTIDIPKFGLFKLNKILKEKYDVIIIGTYATLNGALLNLLLRLKKIKFYINADGGFIAPKESFLSKFLKHYFLSTANYYLSSGKETNRYLMYYGANEKNIYTYPFTSLERKDILDKPTSYEEKRKLRKEKGYDFNRLFISVGRFVKIKGYDLFLQAIKDEKYDDAAFLIIGGGEEKENLEKYIKNNNIKNVFLIDFCDKQEIFNYYKMSDIFFFNSLGDVWGLVINEAMACALPIISTTSTLAATELIEKEYLYDVYDLEKLKKLIREFSNKSDDELYEIGKRNLKVIKGYSIEEMVNEHNRIFKEVIDEENKRIRNN